MGGLDAEPDVYHTQPHTLRMKLRAFDCLLSALLHDFHERPTPGMIAHAIGLATARTARPYLSAYIIPIPNIGNHHYWIEVKVHWI